MPMRMAGTCGLNPIAGRFPLFLTSPFSAKYLRLKHTIPPSKMNRQCDRSERKCEVVPTSLLLVPFLMVSEPSPQSVIMSKLEQWCDGYRPTTVTLTVIASRSMQATNHPRWTRFGDDIHLLGADRRCENGATPFKMLKELRFADTYWIQHSTQTKLKKSPPPYSS